MKKCKVLTFTVLLSLFCLMNAAPPLWAGKNPLIQTSWNRSDGLQIGDEVYFLSSYSLYEPGKVIIPMFIVTRAKVYYSALSLYRLSTAAAEGPSAPRPQCLQRVWTCGPDLSGSKVDLQSCRYAQVGGKLYFQWTGKWDVGSKQSLHPTLEYDLHSGVGRVLAEQELPAEIELDYHPADKVAAAQVWLDAGRLPLMDWELPSPIEYSSDRPAFLKKAIAKQLGDRDFRKAALAALDDRQDPELLEDTLAKMAEERDHRLNPSYNEYYDWMTALILMSRTLRRDRPADIFTAAFDNDVALLRSLVADGADPDSVDSEGRTPLMYAVFGEAPDTLRLLFEQGADPTRETKAGNVAWFYAALNPLRPLYLELWER